MPRKTTPMTRAGFEAMARKGRLHQATGLKSDREKEYWQRSVTTPFGAGLAAGYSIDDIARFYAFRRGAFPENELPSTARYLKAEIKRGYDPFEAAFEEFTADAAKEGVLPE